MSQNRIAKGPESYIPPVICKYITMCYINDIIHDHSKLPQMQNKGRVVTSQPHGLCSKKKKNEYLRLLSMWTLLALKAHLQFRE